LLLVKPVRKSYLFDQKQPARGVFQPGAK